MTASQPGSVKPEQPLDDDDPMPVGEHQGHRMEDVPAKYLLWCADQPFAKDPRWQPRWARVAAYVERNRIALEAEVDADAADEDDSRGDR